MSSLFVAWRAPNPAGGAAWGPVARLDYDPSDQIYRFSYTLGAKNLLGFQPFPGLNDLKATYESEELFPLFANRLLSKSRPEYEAYLRWGAFDPASSPEPIAILGVTEGRRETDSIEVFPCPQRELDGTYQNTFFLHGLRHREAEAQRRAEALEEGDALVLQPDAANQHDPHAVEVWDHAATFHLGYVPRYLASDIRLLLTKCGPESVKLTVRRVNKDAPIQQRVLCQLSSCWPDEFQPCGGADYQPIAEAAYH